MCRTLVSNYGHIVSAFTFTMIVAGKTIYWCVVFWCSVFSYCAQNHEQERKQNEVKKYFKKLKKKEGVILLTNGKHNYEGITWLVSYSLKRRRF